MISEYPFKEIKNKTSSHKITSRYETSTQHVHFKWKHENDEKGKNNIQTPQNNAQSIKFFPKLSSPLRIQVGDQLG